MKNLLVILSALLVVSCSSTRNTSTSQPAFTGKYEPQANVTFIIVEYSQDESYGYTQKNPIKVGNFAEGPANERRFLDALAGPNGEKISYYRIGSCCAFETKNSPFGGGLLDMYNVTYEGETKEIVLYINMYDADVLKVPMGFTLKK